MVEVLGATSTTADVLSGVNLHGKRIFVTGVSAGLGVETARSLTKAEAATMQVRKDAAASGGSFEFIALDLASLKSVRAKSLGWSEPLA
jgi:NAD(P)-dependent dehydrogenase (short-subunit alcohol dehydrogenase family)